MSEKKPDAPEIWQNEAGRWWYRIRGRNGEIMCPPETDGFDSRHDAGRAFIQLQERIWDMAMGREDDVDPEADGATDKENQ